MLFYGVVFFVLFFGGGVPVEGIGGDVLAKACVCLVAWPWPGCGDWWCGRVW